VTTSSEEVARILESQKEKATRDLYFCALLSREIKSTELPIVVVGGSAIEIYTDGAYVSGDIDIVGNRSALASVLESWGFIRKGREWYHERWKLAIDIVNDHVGMTGSRELIRTIVTPYGAVRLAAIEDLITKRLVSAKYWNIPSDREHAAILARKFRAELDRIYLSEATTRAQVADEWGELERRLYPSGRRRSGPE